MIERKYIASGLYLVLLSIQSRYLSTLVYTPGKRLLAQSPLAPNDTIPITAHRPSFNSELSIGPPESPLQLSFPSSPAQSWVEPISTPAIAAPYLSLHVGLSTSGTETCCNLGETGLLLSSCPQPTTLGLSFRLANGNPLYLSGRQAGLKPRLKVTGRCNLIKAISFF